MEGKGDLSSEDEDDSDYEFNGVDLNLYDSLLDEQDELIAVKETLDMIH